ncbi:WavE lipopolysaccharide synthesis family protein [Aeromonas enteropelogenes]|uniref:WavE lipopolysaccharide synthesis family protein n=1 Tax=Aeromonas enteropelogenes TaxID=29489 RepID=UPI0009EE2367|nr:WavE lipopolysaccharide synthesis family protein [Aeromonas enteropelogenes]
MKKTDITFLVQGPVRERTKEALKSIRYFFPGSRVILSTWDGEDIIGLDYDELVLNDDPGCLNIYRQGQIVSTENTNRQIYSVSNAISLVKTKYCVKTRTDIEFVNDNFLVLYKKNVNKYPRNIDNLKLNQRVLISSINTPNPNCFLQYVCQVSDWFFFGLTEDLRKIWCQELILQSEFYHNEDNIPDREYKNGFLFGRFSSEQLITIGFISKYNEKIPKYFRDKDFINFSNHMLASEFISAEPNRIGFTFRKYQSYCELKFNSIRALKSYIAFYSVTTNYIRWNKICIEFMQKRKPNILYLIHDKLCQVAASYLKKKTYKL